MLPSEPQMIFCPAARSSRATGAASLARSLEDHLFFFVTVWPLAARADEMGMSPDAATVAGIRQRMFNGLKFCCLTCIKGAGSRLD